MPVATGFRTARRQTVADPVRTSCQAWRPAFGTRGPQRRLFGNTPSASGDAAGIVAGVLSLGTPRAQPWDGNLRRKEDELTKGRRSMPTSADDRVWLNKWQTSLPLDEVQQAYRQGTRRWSGCDWPTALGRLGLDLNGLESTHATLMARATSGGESTAWRTAARWLKEVEDAARQAEIEAKQAVHLATSGQLPDALGHAQRAVDLAGGYQRSSVWEPLRAAIAELLSVSPGRGRPDDIREPRTTPEDAAPTLRR